MSCVRIRLQKDEQLTPDFLDLFSKLIINNSDFAFSEQLHEESQLAFRHFHSLLAKACHFKHTLKSPVSARSRSLTFNFSSKNNALVLLLDLSPYMLLYNHGTRSFPLANLEEIALHLLRQVAQRAMSDTSCQYRVSVVLFSVFGKEVEEVVSGAQIGAHNAELMCEFVSRSIRKSTLPLDKSPRKESIRDIVQQWMNREESSALGIRAIVVVSSFHEEESGPVQLFTPHWHTLSLVNTGGHFGSYTIDNQQLRGRMMRGSYFRNKFVFSAIFLENWQMTQLLTRRDPEGRRTVQEMFRSIIFQQDGGRVQDVLELMFRFQIVFQQKKAKAVSGGQSVISSIKDNPGRMVLRSYKVPSQSFLYILRTKYVQGWEPVLLNFTSLVQNTKFKLKLQVAPECFLYYEAARHQGNFLITIYHTLQQSAQKEGGSDKAELAAATERIDRINSYNFSALLGQTYPLRESKAAKNTMLFANHEHDAVQQLCLSSAEWGKYFKIRRVCFRFTPELTPAYLQEFFNEISYILGRKIGSCTFVRQSEGERRSEKVDDIESPSRRVLLTRVNPAGPIIQLQMGFLRFSHSDIQATIDSLTAKMHNCRFKWGLVDRVPPVLAEYLRDPFCIMHELFHRRWVLRTRSKHYRDLFRIYWTEVIKRDNYCPTFPKGHPHDRHYYKLIEIRTALSSSPQEAVAFLRVRQPQQRENELHFQLAMRPCFASILPYFREGKAISVPELLECLMGELRKAQQEIVRLIDTYQALHLRLLRQANSTTPKIMGEALQRDNSELYDIRLQHFRSLLGMQCRQIVAKYYKECKEAVHSLPLPAKLLMSTQLEKVQGDIDLTVDGKRYSFFLCTPYKFVYLHQRQGSLFYKIVTLHYEEFNAKQNDALFLETILGQLIASVREQTYIRDFRMFLQGNFKGGISKIISNSQFTHKDQKRINLQPLLALAAPASPPDPKSIEYRRIRSAVDTFSQKLFMLIAEFFPLLRVNYYFQVRADKSASPPFSIDPAISRLDTQLFMRATFVSEGGEVDITPTNLAQLVMRHYGEVLRGKAQLSFCFYLKVKNSGEKNQNSFAFLDYFLTLTERLTRDISFEVERLSQTRRDFSPQQMQFLTEEIKVEVVKLELIRQEQDSVDGLCRHIEAAAMQSLMRFCRVRQSPPEFLAIKEEQPNAILIEKSMLMRIKTGSLLEFVYRPSIFFIQQHREGKEMLQKYLQRLRNYINASRLVQELSETYELPLEPYELWLNDSANHANNKIIVAKKKKLPKNPANKYLRKANPTPEPTPANLNTVSSSKLVPLSLIYRNCLPLNERIPANQGLQALKQDQIFKMNEIHNLKNTYLFLNFGEKDPLVFHFEERDDQALLRQLAEQNKSPLPRCKKYLLYYVFSANPLVRRENVQRLFYQLLKEAVNRKLFDEVSLYLLTHSELIQDDEEFFIRGGGQRRESKECRFDLPQHFYRDQLLRYLQQHIEIYHYPTAFRSEAEQRPSEAPRFLDSIRVIEPTNVQNTKFYSDFMKELISCKRAVSSQETIDVSASTNFQRNRHSDFKVESRAQSTSSMLRSSEGFFDGQTSSKYEYAEGHWLFNSARPRLNLAQKFGKCLYLLRLKIREEAGRHADKQCLVSGRSSFLFSACHDELQLGECKKQLLKKNSTKLIKRESFLRSSIAFEIADYVGSLKLAQTQEAFGQLTRAAIAEYYLENYFYLRYKNAVSNIYAAKCQQNPRETTTVVEKAECSSGSQRTISAAERAMDAERETYMGLLQWRGQVESMLEQINSLLFFRYKSGMLAVRDITVYFLSFLQQFDQVLTELHKTESGAVSVLVYLQESDEKWSFWQVRLDDTALLREKLQGRQSESLVRVGFILTDYLPEIISVLDSILHKKEPSQPVSDRMQALKYLQDIRAPNQSKQYWFRRSLFVSFEMTNEHFTYGSYNVCPTVDREIKEWLGAIDCWLHQKGKLLRFIKNVKENGSYDLNLKPNPQRKADSFYELRYLALADRTFLDRQDSEPRPTISMYRLLVNLVFMDFPLSRREKEENEGKGKARGRYLHHCIQIRELLTDLKNSPVNYSLYNSYKGNQKFLLERLGREYISIIREEYSNLN